MPRVIQKMLNKKNMNKKSNVLNISMYALVFSIASIIYVFISVFTYAAANDYLFYNMQNITEELENQGIVTNGTAALTQTFGDDYTTFNFHLDDLWLTSYIVFIPLAFILRATKYPAIRLL